MYAVAKILRLDPSQPLAELLQGASGQGIQECPDLLQAFPNIVSLQATWRDMPSLREALQPIAVPS